MMLIDLDDFRPKNETYEHFFLKQVARAFLFQNNIRIIGTEVEGVQGIEHPPFGTPKSVIDVLGMDIRSTSNEQARKLFIQILELAKEIGLKYNVSVERNGRLDWVDYYRMRNSPERAGVELTIEVCKEMACEQLGYPKDLHKKLMFAYKDKIELRGVEVKVSYSDFKNGFSMFPEYSYVLAPVGIVPKDELPNKVGLLEFDFEKYEEHRNWKEAIQVAKKPKKQYDSYFMKKENGKEYFDAGLHEEYCRKLLFRLAQQNTEEHIFWNPFIKSIEEGSIIPFWQEKYFKYKIGDVTPLGIVIERRMGKNPDYGVTIPYSRLHQREIPFYRLVVPNEGILKKWISEKELELASSAMNEVSSS